MIERTDDGEAFHYELQSSVRSMSYDFRERRGRLDLEALCCCSMTGAVAMFVAIDQEVQRIETFAGGKPDTAYVRHRQGWQAVEADGRVGPVF